MNDVLVYVAQVADNELNLVSARCLLSGRCGEVCRQRIQSWLLYRRENQELVRGSFK